MEETEQAVPPAVDSTPSAPPSAPPRRTPRVPPMGAKGHGALAPRHTAAWGLETNVERIAIQIALGRPATYD